MKTKKNIYYIVEGIKWVIAWEGKYIAENMKKSFNIEVRLVKSSKRRLSGIINQLLHFGSRNTYLPFIHEHVSTTNTIVLTWYHGTDKDREYIDLLPKVTKKLDIIHTSCTMSRDDLIRWGAEEKKIKIIPIGIDVGHFASIMKKDKFEIRKKLKIPANSFCIGSFQKDGEGWQEGLKPKSIKGPEIFCEVVKKIAKNYPVHVLLTGPARGFVKKQLSDAGISYSHYYPKNNLLLPFFYRALDLYLITSKVEGGPKAMMESFATGVPIVSTDVGMVHDYAINEENAMVSNVDDVEGLAKNCEKIILDQELRKRIIENGTRTVLDLDWKVLVDRYYREIYSNYIF